MFICSFICNDFDNGILKNIISVSYTHLDVYKRQVFNGSALKTATIENGATAVADNLFSNAKNFTKVTIPNTVKKVGSMSFYGCTKLSSVTLPNTCLLYTSRCV